MKKSLYLLLIIATFSCTQTEQQESAAVKEESAKILKVAAVNYPLAFFAEKIGGDNVEIVYPITSDGDPAYWTPSEAEITMYQEADVILLNGAGYAKWTESTTLPTSRLVNTSESVSDRYIETDGQISHSHGPEGEHTHAEIAFTTWLDMTLAKAQATAIRDALKSNIPGKESELNSNLESLIAELDEVDKLFKETLSNYEIVYGSHPVYQYLGRAYGVDIHSVHWEPGQEINHDQWHEFEHILEDHKGTVMLWEGEPAESVAKKLSDQGVSSIVFDPSGSTPDEGDFIQVMKQNASNLTALQQAQ